MTKIKPSLEWARYVLGDENLSKDAKNLYVFIINHIKDQTNLVHKKNKVNIEHIMRLCFMTNFMTAKDFKTAFGNLIENNFFHTDSKSKDTFYLNSIEEIYKEKFLLSND